ncbi:MAG: hypothetical protein WCJ49_08270 [Deltaproteobacteria bacterium]
MYSDNAMSNIHQRLALLDGYRKTVRIGIFGSFYNSRKNDLIQLRDYLRTQGYTNAKISEDLDDRLEEEWKIDNPIKNRELSTRLLNESDIHIFVVCMTGESDPVTLIQSVSMELERLCTLREKGHLTADCVVVYLQKPLKETSGGVFKGLVMSMKNDWVFVEFEEIQELFKTSRQLCYNCLREMYGF